VKSSLLKKFPPKAIVPAVFLGTGILCLLLSIWTVSAIERFSKLGVRRALGDAGHAWADVDADGLKVILRGTAPTEAMRFRALLVAGNVVDAARLRDEIVVAAEAAQAAPEFSIQILRNDDGISLIGLVPASMDRAALLAVLKSLGTGKLTDLLESTDHPAPDGWDNAITFAETATKLLPRAKISVTPGNVAVTALSDSADDKVQTEAALRRKAPKGLALTLDIGAPHPVITPFTVRFLIDTAGARFDACAADSDAAMARILAAATAAGAPSGTGCTVGLGVPTPAWADAVVMGLQAVQKLGKGSITFSDADVTLIADPATKQATFDQVVGELESNLPDVFSLKATIATKDEAASAGAAEFVATLSPEGKLDMGGRLGDSLTRKALESFAAAEFGAKNVHDAARLASGLPKGWTGQILVALQALSVLDSGKVTVRANDMRVEGTSGQKNASDQVARILDSRLGSTIKFDLAIRYDKALDKTLALPTPAECVQQINAALAVRKISFQPGSAIIMPESNPTLDKIAAVMKNCGDVPMEVGGHTDSQGREEMNLVLSNQRAQSVIAALLSRRVLTGNLTAKGYGESQPIMANDTDADREQNRRIEFRLLGADGTPVPADTATTPPAGDAAAGDGSASDGAGTDGTASDGSGSGADQPAGGDGVTVLTPDEGTILPKARPDNLKPQP